MIFRLPISLMKILHKKEKKLIYTSVKQNKNTNRAVAQKALLNYEYNHKLRLDKNTALTHEIFSTSTIDG